MPEPESAPPVGEQPGQTFAPTSEIHGGVPSDPLAETHSVHTDNLQQPDPSAEASGTVAVDTITPTPEPTVKHIDVFQHPGEGSGEEPSATQSMGVPSEPQAVGASLMDKITDHEPTTGPEENGIGQVGDTQTDIRPGEENYIQDKKKAEVMARAEDSHKELQQDAARDAESSRQDGFKLTAHAMENIANIHGDNAKDAGESAGNKYDLEHGTASNELLLSRQKELYEQVDVHSEMLREAIKELKDVSQQLAGKEDSPKPEAPQAA